MKILLLSTGDLHSGAFIAAHRLMMALQKYGHEVRMLVMDKTGQDDDVTAIAETDGAQRWGRFRRYADWLLTLPSVKQRRLIFQFSPARFGFSIHQHPLVQWADIVHLHWVNHGFLSIEEIGRLNALAKPLVWTLHDQWAFTGGCHYSYTCQHYQTGCGSCPLLRRPSPNDLSHAIWLRKQKAYSAKPLHIVTCSEWLGRLAANSSLAQGHPVAAIPNPIDTGWFGPQDKAKARLRLGIPTDRPLLLFGASNLNDPRKGYTYFLRLLEELRKLLPQEQLPRIAFFGALKAETTLPERYEVHLLGSRRGADLVATYAAADLYVTTSQEDNLPNTVMEALACGTAVAAFGIGGIPEMVQNGVTGCLAPLNDITTLAQRIAAALLQHKAAEMGASARQFVEQQYAEALVAERYSALYRQAIGY